ncbi:helix-turn-helix transcriptional regulator [Nitrosovibrio sp. Nv4]|uniref:helix-turn-helix transcriptional regulator n=1 Tax=Nitrosovibrio sp. Nv4 TaxID=1945880 RepID=UPI000BDD4530|nr:helix-turn-helix transcriptional regulator [Nitrosovibrio sp. Nv4]SOD42406.1 hypothetical protein SAMN06298226_2745 [Nitrosovibrio sp. Nv4]
MKKWNDRLDYALKVRNKTPAELARATGTKPPSVKEWLDGITKNIGAGNAVKACGFLKINIDWLLHGKLPSGLEDSSKAADVQVVEESETELSGEQKQILSLIAGIDKETRSAVLTILSKLIPERRKENTLPNEGRRLGEINYRDSVTKGRLLNHGHKINEKRKRGT